ncbi:type II secretion system protein [Eubacterium sp. MSJ-33]|uniref:type II secretion system protein n=1 Tax=Eubacterium sp. MSJ-33 TaxID=2841528 RepID=UPI001C76B688|nr:type II secretion system protein [Eubacterium sp. MSJ-33]QWT53215.1 type II secretion system GspH family protein [Eubacterium sp. MSJ-33]
MKKTNNKGFSLVELIIVIAIMAILAGAIAPALIKYIDKSRKSNDVSSAKTIKTAIETALGTESVYETLTNIDDTKDVTKITILPGESTASDTSTGTSAVSITDCTAQTGSASLTECAKSIGSNIGEKTPKTKYKKEINNEGDPKGAGTKFAPQSFVAFITPGGTVYVCVAPASGTGASCDPDGGSSGSASFTSCAPLAPEVCKGYQ